MKLKIVSTEVVVVAEPGRFVGRADFAAGLNFVRAENNMGKTTLVMSILYALGLEGMLGPGNQMPLKPATTTEIQDEDGIEHPVIESWVTTEIENADGERLTLRRAVVGGPDSRLVTSWAGGALTNPAGGYAATDYYVRMGGAAKREAGLHHRLARFIGWDLPEVVTWDGSSVPLYMEVLAPMLFVEQTRGWSGLGAVMPRYLRIRDPERRAVEFLVGLSGLTRAREREAVSAELAELKADWRAAVEAFAVRASQVGGLVQGLPNDPPADWPPSPPVVVQILHDDGWLTADQLAATLRSELTAATDELPRVKEFAGQATEQLRAQEARLGQLAAQMASASRDVSEQRGELEALDVRIRAVEEDRARYQDAIRLANLGSLQSLAVSDSRCPTCDQSLPHTLVGDPARPVMTLEENKQLLDGELKTFRAMRVDAERVLHASRQKVVGLRRSIDDTRADVRSLKATLTQSGDAPSRALIERQVRIAQRIEQLEGVLMSLVSLDETLRPIADRTRTLKAELARLSGETPSADDDAKLEAFGDSVRSQLDAYGFSSWPPAEIEIAPDSYLPQRAGQTLLPNDLSASDSVRLIWAYLVGLLEVARTYDTAHPGLLVFDEPGQQEISDDSLCALLNRLGSSNEHGQQAIVATSKAENQLTSLLRGTSATRNDYAGHVLR